MADNNCSQRINSHKVINAPVPRERRGARNHKTHATNTGYECEFETLDETREFFEERYVFDFFGGSAPGHVDCEEAAEGGLGHVDGDSA